MSLTLHLLSAGAAQGLATRLQAAFEADAGCRIEARFGAVGAMRQLLAERLAAGESCDLIVLTDALIAALADEGLVRRDSARPIGRVGTAVAVRAADALAPPADGAQLDAALRACDALHVPDLVRSTAGAHVADVLRRLGLFDALRPRIREFPNGATAMRELAGSTSARPLGITQATEILATPGVRLVAQLPAGFELDTLYTAAVLSRSAQPALAAAWIERLTGADTAAARQAAGFAA